MIMRAQRAIHSQPMALNVSEPHPERRSDDSQTILVPTIRTFIQAPDLVKLVELKGTRTPGLLHAHGKCGSSSTNECPPETPRAAQCATGHVQNDGQITVKTMLKRRQPTRSGSSPKSAIRLSRPPSASASICSPYSHGVHPFTMAGMMR